LKLSRHDLAKRSGLAPHLIARIELGRMPLRYGEAEVLLPALLPYASTLAPLNPLWLADGTLPIRLEWPFLLPTYDAIGLDFKTPFSQFVITNRELLAALCKDAPDAELPESWLLPYLMRWAELRVQMAGSETGAAKLGCIFASSAQRLSQQSALASNLLVRFREAEKQNANNVLTEAATSAKLLPVKSQLDILLAKFDRLVKQPGKKTKLADFLGAPLASVSRWLSGKREPGREITLNMLRWVELQERQQKQSAGSVSPPPAPKTQSKASNEKKPKSGRKKD
jgi:transcriptional regulator with XRE-family HTH domain